MYCNTCKKEEEVVKVAGKTYCTNCSNVLSQESGAKEALHGRKIPVIAPDDNEIRTFTPENKREKVSTDINSLAKEATFPAKTPDEFGSSAILMDILSEDAKERQDEHTKKKDVSLESASEKVLDTISQENAPMIRDIKIDPEHSENPENSSPKPVLSEQGYTKEYDMLIILSGFVVILVILAILMFAFKQYI